MRRLLLIILIALALSLTVAYAVPAIGYRIYGGGTSTGGGYELRGGAIP